MNILDMTEQDHFSYFRRLVRARQLRRRMKLEQKKSAVYQSTKNVPGLKQTANYRFANTIPELSGFSRRRAASVELKMKAFAKFS